MAQVYRDPLTALEALERWRKGEVGLASQVLALMARDGFESEDFFASADEEAKCRADASDAEHGRLFSPIGEDASDD